MAKQQKRDPDDVPELTREWFAGAERVADGPEAMRAYVERQRRGRGPQKAPTKQLVSLRLSRETIERYRSTGRGWQSRMDADLEKAAKRLRVER